MCIRDSHGLMRVRCFTQDDAHIFMTKEQITDEIKGVVRLIDEVYRDVYKRQRYANVEMDCERAKHGTIHGIEIMYEQSKELL